MGLFQKAIETYDTMQSLAGTKVEGKETLAPVGCKIAKANIEITVDSDGNFVRARRIEEKIPIPCTEKSAGRTSKCLAAHPLCDNLSYVAEANKERHEVYMEEIKRWKESKYSCEKLNAIYNYLIKGRVLEDCIKSGVAEIDDNGKIKNEKEDIVSWRVEGLGERSGAVYEDHELMSNFLKYYADSTNSHEGICMITGSKGKLAAQHLKGVSNLSGNAKLISSNDTQNYTFRGRFIESEEAATIGYEASQKAHNALKWLLSNYSASEGNMKNIARRLVCWNPNGKKLPQVDLPLLPQNKKVVPSDYKSQLQAVVYGYKSEILDNDAVVIAGFEAATSGRLAVTYYNELRGSDFLERLCYWDQTCCWYDSRWGVKTPGLYQIVNYAFGTQRDNGRIECDPKIVGTHMQRLISCRVNKALFPKDIMRNLVIKATNLQIYEKNKADNLLFIACAAIKKCKYDYYKEEWEMALEENKHDRSYQFGRLLAVLEKIEKDACPGEDRETNAIRTQAFYSQRPLTASKQIMESLKSGYYPRLSNGTKTFYEKLIGTIMNQISDFPSEEIDKPLTETYLMGYYLQKNALYSKKETKEQEEE